MKNFILLAAGFLLAATVPVHAGAELTLTEMAEASALAVDRDRAIEETEIGLLSAGDYGTPAWDRLTGGKIVVASAGGSFVDDALDEFLKAGNFDNWFVNSLRAVDAKIASRLGTATLYDFNQGAHLYAPVQTTFARPLKPFGVEEVEAVYAPLKEYATDKALGHAFYAFWPLEGYLWRAVNAPRDWNIRRLKIGVWGGVIVGGNLAGGITSNYKWGK